MLLLDGITLLAMRLLHTAHLSPIPPPGLQSRLVIPLAYGSLRNTQSLG